MLKVAFPHFKPTLSDNTRQGHCRRFQSPDRGASCALRTGRFSPGRSLHCLKPSKCSKGSTPSTSTRLTLEIAENNCSSSMNTHIIDGFHMFLSCLDSISMSVMYNLVPVFDHPKPSVSENSTAPKFLKQMTTYTGSYVILCPCLIIFGQEKVVPCRYPPSL